MFCTELTDSIACYVQVVWKMMGVQVCVCARGNTEGGEGGRQGRL